MNTKGIIGAIVAGVGIVFCIIMLMICTVKIPAGYVGIVYNMNGGVEKRPLSQGWHLIAPTKHVTKYTIGIEQSYLTKNDRGDSEKNERFTASSSEGKTVSIDLTFTYQYDADQVTDVFTRFKGRSGEQIKDTFIKPNIVSWSKEVIAKYPVADMRGAKRAEVNKELTKYLEKKFDSYGIRVSNVSLINIDVDSQTEKAINNKIKAQQKAEQQAIENKTNVDKAEADAKATEIKAKAKANKIKIEADAEAEANTKLNQSLSDNVIKKQYIEKWDGVLPKVSGDSSPIVDMRDNQ